MESDVAGAPLAGATPAERFLNVFKSIESTHRRGEAYTSTQRQVLDTLWAAVPVSVRWDVTDQAEAWLKERFKNVRGTP